MAYWAELDENNVVLRVTVGDDNDPNGDKGYQWLIDNLGGTWVETFFDSQDFASVGCTYDSVEGKFLVPGLILQDSEYDYELPGGENEQFTANSNTIVLSKEQKELIKPQTVLLDNPNLTEEERMAIHRQISAILFPTTT